MIRVLCAFLLVCLCVLAVIAQDKPARPKAADASKIRDTKDAMRKLAGELTAAKSLLQAYPEKLDELVKNQLIETVPKDGWGRDFIYSRNKETGYELVSLGADGQTGGVGADADITFTEQGLKQELTEEQKAALASKREALRVIGRKVLALFEMKVLGTLVVNHRKDKGSWPEKLSALKPKGESVQDRTTSRCFDDPWKREYTLKLLPNDNFAIVCYGADGADGGEEANADFVITERDVRGERSSDEYEYRGDYNSNNDWRVDDLAEGVRQFKKSNSRLPAELTDLTQGARRIRNDIPKDRFGGDYIYLVAGDEEFYIIALGSDHEAGGIGDGQDSISPRPGQVPYEREEFVQPEEVKPEDTEENKMLALVAEAQMQDIMRAAKAFHAEKKAWPATLDDIKDKLPGKVVPNDPWESAFTFEQVKTKDEVTGVRVICRGCDKAEGGNKAASDFAINDKGERQELAPAAAPPAEGAKPAEDKAVPAGGRFR
jgi:Type II secretion system (T2SS), protein G